MPIMLYYMKQKSDLCTESRKSRLAENSGRKESSLKCCVNFSKPTGNLINGVWSMWPRLCDPTCSCVQAAALVEVLKTWSLVLIRGGQG
jgi:hypothetical protein